MPGIFMDGAAFRKLPAHERREVWEQFLTEEEAAFMASSDEQFALTDLLVENAVGVVPVPLGLASGFVIDGKQYLIPMAVEEPSVIAAAGFGAHIIAAGGGFVTSSSNPLLESYIYLERTRPEALERIKAGLPLLSEKLVPVLQGLTRRGGGLRAIEVQELKETRIISVKLSIDVRDAMGANIVNTAAEALRVPLEEFSGGRVLMCILSNASPERLARAEFSLPLTELSRFVPGYDAGDTARRIELACALANEDPARAVTHNKGIMNGIASLALATMNDTRALEAAAHAWSAKDGRIRSLSAFVTDGTTLSGALELPLAFGVVGGSTDIHPSARAALRLLGNPGSMELARIGVALGLAQNFSALLALVTRGIQSGHMKYHAARIAYKAGARGSEIRVVAEQLALQKDYSSSAAEKLLEEFQAERRKGVKKNTDRDPGEFFPIYAQTSPSLALIKYWGKARGRTSMPATTSLAVTLDGLMTTTILAPSSLRDEVFVHGASENYDRYKAVFQSARKMSALPKAVEAWSWNSFPTGAGIASSSSGFAALSLGLLCMGSQTPEGASVNGISSWSALLRDKVFLKSASRLACRGSVSASRAVYGGFTILPRNKDYAIQLEKATYWDSLRILVIVVSKQTKDISSRNGMKITQATSPFYKAWLHDAVKLSKEALAAFACKDLEKLGHCMRASYMRMHASAMASREPLLYWKPASLAVLTVCEELRKEGFNVWETMDAGPQVKLLYEEHEEERLLARLNILIDDQCGAFANRPLFIHARPGGDPILRTITNEEYRTFRKKETLITRSM